MKTAHSRASSRKKQLCVDRSCLSWTRCRGQGKCDLLSLLAHLVLSAPIALLTRIACAFAWAVPSKPISPGLIPVQGKARPAVTGRALQVALACSALTPSVSTKPTLFPFTRLLSLSLTPSLFIPILLTFGLSMNLRLSSQSNRPVSTARVSLSQQSQDERTRRTRVRYPFESLAEPFLRLGLS